MSEQNQVAKQEAGTVIQQVDGKFIRKAVYQAFSSVNPTTREEKINLFNLLEGEGALAMNDHVGEKFNLVDVVTNPYDRVDEETGELEYGALTYLFTDDGKVYVTSSKSVYHTIQNLMKVFGEPHYNEEEAPILQIVKRQGQTHKYVDVKVIG